MNRLAAAIANLHSFMPNKPGGRPYEGAAGIGAGMGAAYRQRGGQDKKAPEASTHDPAMYKQYVDATGANKGLEQEGSAFDPEANAAILQAADQNYKTSMVAEDARLGGRFTPNGLEKAHKTSMADGNDRLMLRGLIGMGGSMVQPQEPPQALASEGNIGPSGSADGPALASQGNIQRQYPGVMGPGKF